jgi:hypothetical protein|nr:MAG TPA: tRNA synthetase [Bacteriophage sp.]
MIVYYQRPTYLEYNLDIKAFIDFLVVFYTDVEGNHWDKLDFQDEEVVCEFIDDLGDNMDWYLEKFGCKVSDFFSEENLEDIYNEVISKMKELGMIKSI